MLIPVKFFYPICTQWNQMSRTHLNWFLPLVLRHKLGTTKETNYLTKHLSPEENSIVWFPSFFFNDDTCRKTPNYNILTCPGMLSMVLIDWGSVDSVFTKWIFPAELPKTTPAPGTRDAADSTYPGYWLDCWRTKPKIT